MLGTGRGWMGGSTTGGRPRRNGTLVIPRGIPSFVFMKLFCGQLVARAQRDLRVIGAVVICSALAGSTVWAAAEPEDEAEPLVQIPDRDEEQITQARALTLTPATLPAEVGSIATVINRAIDPAAHLEVMRLVERFRGNAAALANAAAIAWVQGVRSRRCSSPRRPPGRRRTTRMR